MTSSDITSLLRQLATENEKLSLADSQGILDQIKDYLTVKHSLESLEQFDQLIEFVFKGNLTLPQKNFIVRYLIIPPSSRDSVISPKLIFRIIGSIGKPMSRLEKKVHSGIPITLQTNLLKWLLCSLHLFDPIPTSSILVNLLPILFQSLIYEFLRPFIAHLIFLTLVNSNILLRGVPLRVWQLKLVIDLHFRFPSDDSLKNLLVLFNWLDPSINYKQFIPKGSTITLGYISPRNLFDYPDDLCFQHFKARGTSNILESNLKHYERFRIIATKKRRRLNAMGSGAVDGVAGVDLDLDVVDYSQNTATNTSLVSIQEISSLKGLVEELENVQFINISSLFRSIHDDDFGEEDGGFINNRFKLLLQVLKSGETDEKITLKIDYYLRLTFIDPNTTIAQLSQLISKIKTYLLFGNKMLPLIQEFILENRALDSTEVFLQKLKLLRYLPFPTNDGAHQFLEFFDLALEIVSRNPKKHLLPFFLELSITFTTWYKLLYRQSSTLESQFDIYNKTLPKIFTLYANNVSGSTITTYLSFVQVLRFIKSIDVNHLNDYVLPLTITLPPHLVYALVLSSNPFVLSEICGFISYCKKYKFDDLNEDNKRLQNCYIMDILNFIWRDNAFKHEDSSQSFNKAMMLHPQFIDKISISNTLAYSNMIQFPSIGNIFYNPSWAHLSADILRDLEDAAGDSINTRHAGPPTHESVNRLLVDSEVKWLNIDYQELKVLLLRKLDENGFDGLGDLLFSSLKTLAFRRNAE